MSAVDSLIVIGPWVLSGSVAYSLSGYLGACGLVRLISFGVASFCSFYLVSFLAYLNAAHCVLGTEAIYKIFGWLFVLAVAGLLSKSRLFMQVAFRVPDPDRKLLLAVLSTSTILVAGYIGTISPLSAWDFLGQWPEPGYSNLSLDLISRTSGWCNDPYVYSYRHPPTLIAILAWSAVITQESAPVAAWWLLTAISLVAVTTGVTMKITRSPTLSGLSALSLLTLPLYENHLILAGYAEAIIAASTTVATALAVLGAYERKISWIFIGILINFLPAFTKNAGLLYSLPMIAGACSALLLQYLSLLRFLYVSASVTVISSILLFNGWSLTLLGISMAWDPDSGTVTLGTRSEQINIAYAAKAIWNFYYASFYNSSFSVAIFTILLAITVSVRSINNLTKHNAKAAVTVFVVAAMTMLATLIATQLTSYGMVNAVPGQDTGGTRFALPLAALVALIPCIAHLLLARENPLAPILKT